MAGSRAVAGRIEDEIGISHARKQESSQRKMGTCQKDTEANLKGLPRINLIWTK